MGRIWIGQRNREGVGASGFPNDDVEGKVYVVCLWVAKREAGCVHWC